MSDQETTAKMTTSNTNSPSPLDSSVASPPEMVSISQLFSFARTTKSKLCLLGSAFFASVSGAVVPASAFVFASVSGDLGASTSSAAFMESIREQAFTFMVLGAVIFVSMTMQSFLAETAAAEMSLALKQDWFRALLRQDIAYYDSVDVSGQGTMITVNANKYRKGVGKKLSLGIQFFVTFVGSVGYSFYSSWQVTLIVIAIGPLFVVSGLFVVKMNTSATTRSAASYAHAGSIVQASVSGIRTVLSLNAVDIMTDKFKDATKQAYDGAVGQVGLVGLANGSIMGSMILSYFVVTLFGAYLLYDQVKQDGCDPSDNVDDNETCEPSGLGIFGALLGMTFGASILPQASATIESVVNARVACFPAFAVIHREVSNPNADNHTTQAPNGVVPVVDLVPPYTIDSSSDKGKRLPTVVGTVEFNNVSFRYPTRPEVEVLKNFSLKIEPGTTVALVGSSGSGKSTCVQLMERFYDPTEGMVTLDGVDLRELNIRFLRNCIGLVQQEPKLFECSIRDNIAMGKLDASDKDVEQAAKMANAHDFIMSFPKGYDTDVGALGDQLSGGQRQRISIARCLVKVPRLLLLDESTSALDSESEASVQQALEQLMKNKNMTTFVIAHRLSTIRNADMIAVLDAGQIVETGTHNELLANKSHYFRLVEAQKIKPSKTSADTTPVASEHGIQEADVGALDGDDKGAAPVIFEFEDVHFEYPSRRNAPVFRGLNLAIRQGETLALVGPSGSGKSTTIQLMESFYRPTHGALKYKGVDLAEINVRWLRDQIGLVSQQPVLFDCSIEDNIRYGLPGATHEQVVEAAKQANAHNFIMTFPDGYKTSVGPGSTLVSGGQKQRICIARSLIKKPQILLLDEATSALDSTSEKIVQAALDEIMSDPNQTCVVIAHRLSTIANADRIAVVEDGRIREIGTHANLMAKPDGRYRLYQSLQSLDDVPIEKPTKGSAIVSNDVLVALNSDTGNEPDDEESVEVDDNDAGNNAKRARMLASGDGFYFFVGGLGALFAGLIFPMWGLGFAFMTEIFFHPVSNCPPLPTEENFTECDEYWVSESDKIKEKALKVSFGYLAIIVCALGGYFLLYWGFGLATERMNRRVRDAAFSSLLRQEVAWFDIRSPGTITSRLSDDAALLHAYSGEPIRSLVAALSSVLVGVVLSFAFMWPFALLVLIIIPLMGWAAELEMQMYLGIDEADEAFDAKSPGGIVIEALSNIRTIASLTLEDQRALEYKKCLEKEDVHAIRNSATKGATAGFGQFVQMWGMSLMFWWGGWLLVNYPGGVFTYRDFLISMFSLLFSLTGLSVAFEGAVDRTKAKRAAARIFDLIDRQSLIDPLGTQGQTNIQWPSA